MAGATVSPSVAPVHDMLPRCAPVAALPRVAARDRPLTSILHVVACPCAGLASRTNARVRLSAWKSFMLHRYGAMRCRLAGRDLITLWCTGKTDVSTTCRLLESRGIS